MLGTIQQVVQTSPPKQCHKYKHYAIRLCSFAQDQAGTVPEEVRQACARKCMGGACDYNLSLEGCADKKLETEHFFTFSTDFVTSHPVA